MMRDAAITALAHLLPIPHVQVPLQSKPTSPIKVRPLVISGRHSVSWYGLLGQYNVCAGTNSLTIIAALLYLFSPRFNGC